MTTVAHQARPLDHDSGAVLRPLDQLAAELRREHELCEAAYRRALEHAFRCGDLLIEAKAQLGHGDWLPWLEGNFAGSDRTARGYMQLARGSDEERRSLADMGIHKALKQLAAPQPARPIGQALRELGGPTAGAMDELGSVPAPPDLLEPGQYFALRDGVSRKTAADIKRAAGKLELALGALWQGRELVPEAAALLMRDAAALATRMDEDLRALADHVTRR